MAGEDYYYVADYNNGVLLYRDSVQLARLETPSPVRSLARWNNNIYLAYLLDTRFILFRNDNGNLSIVSEFASPGFTTSYVIENNYLYVMDSDSGLTIYKDPADLKNIERFPAIVSNNVLADRSSLITYYPGGTLKLYRLTCGITRNNDIRI